MREMLTFLLEKSFLDINICQSHQVRMHEFPYLMKKSIIEGQFMELQVYTMLIC